MNTGLRRQSLIAFVVTVGSVIWFGLDSFVRLDDIAYNTPSINHKKIITNLEFL